MSYVIDNNTYHTITTTTHLYNTLTFGHSVRLLRLEDPPSDFIQDQLSIVYKTQSFIGMRLEEKRIL